MAKLRDVAQIEDICAIVDIFASEYGWTISEIQSLTIPELSCLLRCILKRKGVKDDDLPSASKEDDARKLIKLARELGASPADLKKLQNGEGVKL